MNGDRGQALVLAVIALAVAAVTIVGLRAVQDRILSDVRDRRAGEAAVEAAGAAVADAELELMSSLRDQLGSHPTVPTRSELDVFAADPLLAERARAAAAAMVEANGGSAVRDLAISIGDRTIEVALTTGAHRHRVAIEASCCPR